MAKKEGETNLAKKEVQHLRLSWSSLQSFLSCQRKYDLAYNEKLQRKPSAAHRNMLLGSAFHAGLEAALLCVFEGDYHQMVWTEEWLLERAFAGAEAYMEENVVRGKVVRDTLNGVYVEDYDYYAMVREVAQLVRIMLRFHIPMLKLGQRYTVPTVSDVVSGQPPTFRTQPGQEPVPAIEWHFEFPIDDNTILSGYIDTILWDNEEQDYVLVDWKTRGNFPYDNMALIDGQLHLYAGVVNTLAEHLTGVKPISRVMMFQMRTKLPSPASISKRTNLPNMDAKSYDTTWDYWVATLPKGLQKEAGRWEAHMRPKLKHDSDYQRPVSGIVTDISTQMALDNVKAAILSIRAALDSGMPLPAILSSNGCKWCDFAPLCTNVLRYGGDAASILEDLYERKEVVADELEAAED